MLAVLVTTGSPAQMGIKVQTDVRRSLTIPVQTFTQIKPHNYSNVSFIPQSFYTTGLPFFCRQELKLQQAHVPLIFRVGSVDNCNYLEEKPGYKSQVR
jgi:hypothetical protein